jgi:small subunit ribosomal protein S6e
MGRRRLLLSKGQCFNPTEKGIRRKKSVRGNTINQDIVQINMKVTKFSSKSIDQLIKVEEKKEKKEETKEVTKEEPKEEQKEEPKVEQKEEKKEEQE